MFRPLWETELRSVDEAGLRRRLRARDEAPFAGLIDFGSNDYLGLARDARVVAAAQEATARLGVGAGASRVLSGTTSAHQRLERRLADFKRCEAALVFSSGYAASVGVLAALASPKDVIFADRLNHASLLDGCRLSGARLMRYRHRDVEHLRWLLARTTAVGRRWLVTDGVFSVDGDLAPLNELAELADEHEAGLVVDDAHATGVLGPEGRGTAALFDCEDRVAVQLGTLSKALGSQGGFAAGPQALIDLLLQRARAFLFSTGLAPALAAAADAALDISTKEPDRRIRLHENLHMLGEKLAARGYSCMGVAPAPMRLVLVGGPDEAVSLSQAVEAAGVYAPALRPPTVPAGTSRLRLTPTAAHRAEEVVRAASCFPMRTVSQ